MPTLPVKSRVTAMAEKLIQRLGRQIKWTPIGAPSRTIFAIVNILEGLASRITESGEELVRRATILVLNDGTKGVTAIAEGDGATFDSESWSADAWGKGEYGMQRIELVQVVELRKSNRERIEDL